jgi:hypothetical protein
LQASGGDASSNLSAGVLHGGACDAYDWRCPVQSDQVARRIVVLPSIGQVLVFQGKLPDPDVPESERTVSASYAHRPPTDEELGAVVDAFYPDATWEEEESPVRTIRFAHALAEPTVIQ